MTFARWRPSGRSDDLLAERVSPALGSRESVNLGDEEKSTAVNAGKWERLYGTPALPDSGFTDVMCKQLYYIPV